MKFICTQQNLVKGVTTAEKIISRNFTLPILQNVLIKCEPQMGFVVFTSTDLEMGLEMHVPAKVEEGGAVTVPVKLLSGLVRTLPQENIVLCSKMNTLSLECKNYKSNIKGEAAGEFPLIPTSKDTEELFVKKSDFFTGLSAVASSASGLEVKPELTGVFAQFREDSMCFTATDSFRLSEKTIPFQKKNAYLKKAIIPRKSADAIVRVFEGQGEDIALRVEDNQIFVKSKEEGPSSGKAWFVSRLIDGEYPNYEQIIPSSFRTTLRVSRDEIARHIKSAGLFSQKINEVVLYVNLKKQQLEIVSQDQECGDYHSALPCEAEGEEVRLVFNVNYLLDGVQAVSGPLLSIKTNEEASPILVSSAEYDGFRYVLMPIKAQ
jgi:DNA polymerase-3 subunit beta